MARSVQTFTPWILNTHGYLSVAIIWYKWCSRLYSKDSPMGKWLREQVEREADR